MTGWMGPMPSGVRGLLPIVLAWSIGPLAADEGTRAVSRQEEPVIVSAAGLADVHGTRVSDVFLFRWNGVSGSFEPIPFQVDERVEHVFNPGTVFEVREVMYDVLREDDRLLDGLDEIAFVSPGERAPAQAAWPAGADARSYEIEITDPLAPTAPSRWAYLFLGVDLPRSSEGQVTWNGSVNSGIVTRTYELGYLDRWILTGFRVSAPCGSGEDLIDRLKTRAGLATDRAETEEAWNSTSSFLGSLVGPVRAIRYVRGAASGVNTVHHDIVTNAYWQRHANLRVHPLSDVWFYVDMRPRGDMWLLTDAQTTPVAIDGDPEDVPTAAPRWSLVRSPAGGLLTIYNLPPSPFVGGYEFFYQDDADFDDKPFGLPAYGDEDDSAIGNHGIHIDGLSGEDTDTIPLGFRVYPLCAGEGDAARAEELVARSQMPLATQSTLRIGALAAVRSLQVEDESLDVVLRWLPVSGATSYRVYRADTASLAPEAWTLLGEIGGTEFRDAGEAAVPQARFYSVTAVGVPGEGPR